MSRHSKSIVAVVLGVGLVVAIQSQLRSPPDADDHSIAMPAETTKPGADNTQQIVADASLLEPLTVYDPLAHTGPSLTIPVDVQQMLEVGDYRDARAELMALAESAVNTGNQAQLADSLTLLGMAALAEPDLDAAELFFMEALDIFATVDNSAGAARVYMQLGHLHVIARERARRASTAYDRLLVARWQISQGSFYEAESQLLEIIDSNIKLKRYGAAASASVSLAKALTGSKDFWRAQQTAMEAIRLYAASGQKHLADRMINELVNDGTMSIDHQTLRDEVVALTDQFQNGVMQIEQARDYRRLYNHYRAKGDDQRAWKFRRLASQSLAGVSKRAMYHRQPDVLVTLYTSNRSLELATHSLDEARRHFEVTGSEEGVRAVNELNSQIY